MKSLERRVRPPAALALCLAAVLGMGGCASRNNYPGATEQQQMRDAAAAQSPQDAAAAADSQGVYLKLVEQMQRDGLWFASLAHLDALEKRWGGSPEATRLRADALRQTEQPAEAGQAYAKLMGTPLEGAGYRGLGLLAGGASDFPKAIELLEQAQRMSPTDGLLLSDLGYANLRAGRVAQARVPLMQAMQLQPDNAQVQANLALYLLASGQPEPARALMEAQRMPAATQAAVQAAARGLVGAPAAVPAPPVAVAPVRRRVRPRIAVAAAAPAPAPAPAAAPAAAPAPAPTSNPGVSK